MQEREVNIFNIEKVDKKTSNLWKEVGDRNGRIILQWEKYVEVNLRITWTLFIIEYGEYCL